jgi:hypothetical protein
MMAPKCMGLPQNAVRSLLSICRWRTYLVSLGGSIGGITSVISRGTTVSAPISTCVGLLMRLPGEVFHCWPSP